MNCFYILCFVLLSAMGSMVGQTTTTIDFETAGDGYTPSTTQGSGDTDVFNRADPNIGGNSTFLWAAEDLPVTDPSITLDQIDITGATNFDFSIDFLTPNTEDWDTSDELIITYSVDGGADQNLIWVQSIPDGDAFNAPAALDLGFDGDGDVGQELPALVDGANAGVGSNFQTFSSPTISLSGNTTLDITIQFNGLDATAEGIYIDNIEITHNGGGGPVPTVGWDNTTRTESETNSTQTLQIPVTLSNYTQNVDLDVAVTGGTAEMGDYTLNTTSLSFTGNGTQNVSIDINDDADFDDETIEITLTESTSTGITISPDVHTITVLDDDMAPLPIAFINEFNYDNVGADNSEYIEVAIEETFNGSLSDFEVVLYNGSGGVAYDTRTLNNFTQGNTTQGYIFYYFDFPSNGIQNGGPDGLALGYQGNLIEFISYEGTFTASGGIANSTNSTDVLVSENNSAPDLSVQRTGSCSGDCPSGLTWATGSLTKGVMNTNAVLPVTWLSVNAEITNKSSVQINWQTAEERNNDHFVVQHSTNGTAWSDIGKVKGAGNSNTLQSYRFTHLRAKRGTNFYRIQQVDIDGISSLSPVRLVQLSEASVEPTHAYKIYPNPTRDFIQISGRELSEINAVRLFDQWGKLLLEWRNDIPQVLSISTIPAGVYLLQIQDSNQKLTTERVIKID